MLVLAASALTSCGGGGEASTVEVTLQEFAVIPALDTASAGSVTFNATNEGPDDPHELVVIQTELAPESLPTTDEGGVDEDGEGIEVIGEIDELPVGETESGTFDLEAGDYTLICNIVEEEDGTTEAHYALGMRVGFVVS
jgi:hypothetical protein